MIPHPIGETIFGPGHDGEAPKPEGIRGSDLNARQRALFVGLISEWVNVLPEASATPKVAEVQSNIANTWFAWSGPRDGGPAYFRIQGPTVQIEYAPQDGANHIHTFYRDPADDYGARLLRP